MEGSIAEFRGDFAPVVVMAASVVTVTRLRQINGSTAHNQTHDLAEMPLFMRYSAIASVSAWVRQYLFVAL
jgi:hypothetical protein